jgi:hypothetical protein
MPSIQFPLILAGPLLRRVEPTQVYFWIVTSQRCKVKANLYKIHDSDRYEKLESISETKTVRMGKKIFIHLIKAIPLNSQFPTDTLLGYNLNLLTQSETHDLGSLGLLSSDNPYSIVFGSLKFPTFQIKSENADSNILYGSCRKLHGKGNDSMKIADSLLEKEAVNLRNRPDSLFLMGDQIYADDVADPIIRFITFLSKELMGHHEPLEKLEHRLQNDPYQTTLRLINGRQFIMEDFCQFTSSQAQNHLMELGEYAAMYLLSWNPELWEAANKDFIETFEDAEVNQHIHFSFPVNTKEYKVERSLLKKRYNQQLESLYDFQRSLPKVRRLIANIPTYMIFDDHDVTDDWNISSNWRRNVEASPLGRHVIANGLTAYWAFQGWGNDPEAFNDDFLQIMKSYLKRFRTGRFIAISEKWVKLLWNFDSWHFVSPTIPKAVFLDSRTQRGYDSKPTLVKFGKTIEEEPGAPQLLGKNGWKIVSNKLRESKWESNSPLIIVAATPVYGMGLIESFIHDYVYPFKILGVDVQTSFDFVSWKYNGEGFTEFLQHAGDWSPNPCIVLSGDVHYASSVKSKVTFQDGRELVLNQYTSSPLKNMSFSGLWGLIMKAVIWVNTRSRIKKDIYRYCTPDYQIIKGKNESFLWKDQLRYQFIKKESIIETHNNLGFLSITKGDIQNKLFT